MDTCEHTWRKVHEQSLLGGSFPVGWRCPKCNKYIAIADLTPAGLPGRVLPEHELVGVHGCRISSESGRNSARQIYNEETKTLTYVD